jgi:hypothetical protein
LSKANEKRILPESFADAAGFTASAFWISS